MRKFIEKLNAELCAINFETIKIVPEVGYEMFKMRFQSNSNFCKY